MQHDVNLPRRSDSTTRVEVTRANIAKLGASSTLAIDPSIIGRTITLSPPKAMAKLSALADGNSGKRAITAGVVTIRGPLAQREERDLCGYVDGYDTITARFAAAHGDPEVDAVIVDIDSCGGDVAGLEQAVAKMRDINVRSGKPVFFYVNESAYSAAYWLAAELNTDGISLPVAGGVGSIGVLGGLLDETGALEQEGLKVTVVRVPDGKAESHPMSPVNELAEQRLRAHVSEVAERFFAAMASARGLTTDQVRGFNGGTFNGSAAVKAGLADKVETFESLVARAQTAGRKWRRSMEKTAMDEKKFEELQAFQASAFGIFGVNDPKAFVGVASAAKQAHDAAPQLNAKVAAYEENLSALQKQSDDRDAKASIDAAQAAHKVVPATRAKVEAFYASHGLVSLRAFLDAVAPVVPSAASAPSEPKPTGETPRQLASVDPNGGAPVAAGTKAFEAMAPMEKHAYRALHGADAYNALKQDSIDRGQTAAG